MNFDDIDFADILTKAAGAVIILVITWILARVVKTVLTRALGKIKALQGDDGGGQSVGASLGSIAALIIWLFGLMAVLNLFDLTQVVTPIQNLLDGALAALPGILGAGILFLIGLVLAKIARELVETALRTAGADRVMGKLQSTDPTPAHAAAVGGTDTAARTTADDGPKLSKILGQLVFVIVLVVVSISAVQVLGIAAISEPATEMLTLILNAIPSILAAA
uniref:mechanosensitive ion channel n=1 Tax=Nocardioides sp. TaxID=35761 RepID=UPI002B26BCDB